MSVRQRTDSTPQAAYKPGIACASLPAATPAHPNTMKTSQTLRNASRTWTTSSYGDTTETSPMELDALREHVAQCSRARGRMAALASGTRRAQGFLAGRLMTTLVLLVALVGAALWIF
jgi:hypothetical protein